MAKRKMKPRVIKILEEYPKTRNAENPDTMIFCLMAIEDGIITKEQAKKIFDKYSINNIVKSRQKIQNKEKSYIPDDETIEKRHVGYMNFRHAWRKDELDV